MAKVFNDSLEIYSLSERTDSGESITVVIDSLFQARFPGQNQIYCAFAECSFCEIKSLGLA